MQLTSVRAQRVGPSPGSLAAEHRPLTLLTKKGLCDNALRPAAKIPLVCRLPACSRLGGTRRLHQDWVGRGLWSTSHSQRETETGWHWGLTAGWSAGTSANQEACAHNDIQLRVKSPHGWTSGWVIDGRKHTYPPHLPGLLLIFWLGSGQLCLRKTACLLTWGPVTGGCWAEEQRYLVNRTGPCIRRHWLLQVPLTKALLSFPTTLEARSYLRGLRQVWI